MHLASILLKYEAVAHGQVLYCEDEKERIEIEVAITKEYIDEKYTRDIYYNALGNRIKEGTF